MCFHTASFGNTVHAFYRNLLKLVFCLKEEANKSLCLQCDVLQCYQKSNKITKSCFHVGLPLATKQFLNRKSRGEDAVLAQVGVKTLGPGPI